MNKMENDTTNHQQRPGREHKRLEVFVGKWKTEGLTRATESIPSTKIKGTDTYEWLEGGFFLIHHVDVNMGDEKVRAIEIVGYDDASNKYPMKFFDSLGNSGAYMASVEDGVWNFTGNSERATVRFSEDGNIMTVQWEQQVDNSKWEPWMDMKLYKIK
jgi:Protein of unknown function (DUF1579)